MRSGTWCSKAADKRRRSPSPPAGSDFFDALDSSNGKDNNYYNGDDLLINSITNGDGKLDVTDLYVTFRRSLDPS